MQKRLNLTPNSRLTRDEITEARANILYQEVVTAKSFRKFIEDLGHRLTPAEERQRMGCLLQLGTRPSRSLSGQEPPFYRERCPGKDLPRP